MSLPNTSTSNPNPSQGPPSQTHFSYTEVRMHRETLPSVGDIVACRVTSHPDETMFMVSLLEYGGVEALLLVPEITYRRVRSKKLLKPNQMIECTVLRVDEERGYVDLSRKRVQAPEAALCRHRFARSRTVHSILGKVAERTGGTLASLYETIGWPLADQYDDALEGLCAAMRDPSVLDGLTLSDTVHAELLAEIGRRLAAISLRLRADIKITCFTNEGVVAIRRALKAAEQVDPELKVVSVGSPQYALHYTCLDREAGLARLHDAIRAAQGSIRTSGGSCDVHVAPHVVNESDLPPAEIISESDD